MQVQLFIAAILGLGAGSTAIGQAQPPMSSSELGHIDLRLAANGETTNLADEITLYVPIMTSAETAETARSSNMQVIKKLTKALVDHGIPRSAITVLPVRVQFGFVGTVPFAEDPPSGTGIMKSVAARKTESSRLRIQYSDPLLTNRVQAVLDDQNMVLEGLPTPSLRNDRSARNTAIADALSNARRDADAYAAALSMRVYSVRSVSNVGDRSQIADPDLFAKILMKDARESSTSQVTTHAQVWVTYDLGPR